MRNTCEIFSPLLVFIFSVKLLNFSRLFQILRVYYYYSNVFRQMQRKIIRENCRTKTRRKFFWRFMRCSTRTLPFTQCPKFSKTSQTYLSSSLQFSQVTVRTWLHFSLTTIRWFRTGNYFPASNKLRGTLHAFSTLVIYPTFFLASIECPHSTILTSKTSNWTNFCLSSSIPSG